MLAQNRFILLFAYLIHINQAYLIGLLLDSEDPAESDAISRLAEFTVSDLNRNTDSDLHIKEQYHDSTYLSVKNSFCALLDENVIAIISASDSTLTDIQANFANQFHIPLISAVATNPFTESSRSRTENFEMRLSPSDVYQSLAIFDLLKEYSWYEFSILASADDYGINSIVYLQYLASQDDNFRIRDIQHFDVKIDVSADSPLFEKELQLIKDSVAKVVVLNCAGKFAKRILGEARDKNLMDESFVWITTDAITGWPETIAYQNMSYPPFYTGLIGTVPQYGKGTKSYNDLADNYIVAGGQSSDLRMSSVKIAMGLSVTSQSLTELDRTSWSNSPSVSCKSGTSWDGGQTLYSKIYSNLDSRLYKEIGVRNPSYDIMNFRDSIFQKVGTWDDSNSLTDLNSEKVRWVDRRDVLFLGGGKFPPTGIGYSLHGYHLRIGIVPEPPIAMLKDICIARENSSDPDCWEGWNPDIIRQLQKDLHFTYEYVRPADDKYGGYDNETKTWNGMIKDILDRKIDLTIALSINSERSKYIDYTSSIYEDQAAVIYYVKPSSSSSNLFFFLEPFDLSVWLSIIGLILVIAFLTTFFSKFSPFGTYGRKIHAMQVCKCSKCVFRRKIKAERQCRFVDTKTYSCLVEKVLLQDDDDINELSYYNSTWLVGTGFVLQGTDTLPTAPSGRFLLFIWWLFIMILTAMYTANLTAHLTLDRAVTNIRELEDLLVQKEYRWGLIQDRNLETMMSHHEDKTYNQIADKAVPLQNLDESIEEVKKGEFVFVDESSVLSYNFKDDCDTVLIKTGKFNNQWAFGTQVNSAYAPLINRMFLQYREKGWLTKVFDKWYTSHEVSSCERSVGSDTKFGLPVLLGLFLILGVGAGLSLITVFLEILYVAHQDSVQKRKSFGYCLRERIILKYREVTEEWFCRRKTGHDSNMDLRDVAVDL